MEEKAVNNKIVPLRNTKEAKKQQRKSLHNILSSDEEYANLQEHIILSNETVKSSIEDIKAETNLKSVENVMQLIQHDIQGYGTSAISELMGVKHDDVLAIRRSDTYKALRTKVMSEIIELSKRAIEVSTIKAVKTLMECMESKNDKVKLSAAVEVLNRTGLTATQKIELTTTTHNEISSFTDEELAEILRGSQGLPANAEVIEYGK